MYIKNKKSLGQNFIYDKNFLKKISHKIDSKSNNIIIEIGPGLGTLTEFLIKKDFKKLILLEKDIRLIDNLKRKFSKKNIEIINIDALNFDYQDSKFENLIIVGNLPFNISVELLYLFTKTKKWPPKQVRMLLMFQKEVANRIIAPISNKAYGKLSVLVQSRYRVKKIQDVPSSIFKPVPKVDATILDFTPFNDFGFIDIDKIDRVAKDAFSQRRKKIKNNMSNYLNEIKSLSISLDLRPEDLSVLDYCNIAKSILD